MLAFESTFIERKKEIEGFLELMEFLEKKEIEKQEGISLFDRYFHSEVDGISLSYQSIINIMKSNVSLMIYNIIEFTVSNLIDSIYDAIEVNGLTYIDVNDDIKFLWRKSILKSIDGTNANFDTFIKKNEEIINYIIEKKIILLKARNSIKGGNLDGIAIQKTFEAHGIRINTDSKNYRPDILKSIREQRNNLAHGSVSFVEAVRTDTINDINKNKNFIITFLQELIKLVTEYIVNEKYKQCNLNKF